jgi:hypothetical protein
METPYRAPVEVELGGNPLKLPRQSGKAILVNASVVKFDGDEHNSTIATLNGSGPDR